MIRLVYREVFGFFNETFFPFAHTFTFPARHSFFENGEIFIGNHQIFINANDFSITFTFRAGAVRVIKTEKMNVGFHEFNTVELKFVGEIHDFSGVGIFQGAIAVTFIESHLNRIREALKETFVFFIFETVDHKVDLHIFLRHEAKTFQIFNSCDIFIHFQTRKTKNFKSFELFGKKIDFKTQRTSQKESLVLVFFNEINDVGYRIFFHFLAGNGRKSSSNSRKK